MTREELARHNSEMDCWTAVDGKVYDITNFVKLHPGGRKILRASGIDGTELFKKYHMNVDIGETIVACFFVGLLVD